MDSRKRKTNLNLQSPVPHPPSSSSVFRDISNFRTPRNPSRTLSFQSSPQFVTSSKDTPISSSRRGLKTSVLKSKARRRLKAFELEQSKSARNAQIQKEKSLKSLARSLTVWLNFLFENPSSCGCDAALDGGVDSADRSLCARTNEEPANHGKRESVPGVAVGVDGPWRGPKRQRSLWRKEEGTGEGGKDELYDSSFSVLRVSLRDVCSFEDLKERMRMYLSLAGCKEVFEAMAQATKNIDGGRIKMRASCPVVSDVGIKENAMRVLMCYNTVWLRIGLYIILGGESLLPSGDVNSDQETAFLKMVIEQQFFSHPGLAKAYAYNRQVEGLYRPGYYEKLGNVILKRFLLLVIILDRAKAQTSLPLKYGLDGLDGGSPLLFSSKSNIKSSRQLLSEVLSSDVMHGEGNLLAHLVIIGYKVAYQQNPLTECDFHISDLFGDLQDGVRLCRAIGLLTHDSSILMKVVVPSDTQKKNLVNCGIALQYLKKAGVPLVDEDGTDILGDDVVNGDKELTLALLWNMFVHLQLPLLVNKSLLLGEILNIRGTDMENSGTQTLLDLLLNWIQAICETYEFKVENHSSLLDGKAMWCLLDYYFRKEHDCSCSLKEPDGAKIEMSIMSAIEYTDAVHNFLLSQKLTSLLGNFPEVLQVSDILEHKGACNAKSVLVLLVFLSVQLLVKRNVDKLNFHKLLGFTCQSSTSRRFSTEWNNEQDTTGGFQAIMAWWQDMAQHNGKCNLNRAAFSTLGTRKTISVQRENAATIIQSHFRRIAERRKYLRMMDAVLVLQRAVLVWLVVKKKTTRKELTDTLERAALSCREKDLEKFRAYSSLMIDRHYFVNLKKSIIIIQHATRAWISKRHYQGCALHDQISNPDLVNASIVVQSFIRGCMIRLVFNERVAVREKTSVMYEEARLHNLQSVVAVTIQSHYRCWSTRKDFVLKKQAVRLIQRTFRSLRSRRDFQLCREAIIIIQSHARGWMARKRANREKHLLIVMQSYCRGWLKRKQLLFHKDAATKIQNAFRCMKNRKAFLRQRRAAVEIQCFVRGVNDRKRLLENAAIIIQSHFRGIVEHRKYLRMMDAALVLQSAVRAWVAVRKKGSRKEIIHRIEQTALSRRQKDLEKFRTYASLMIDRHYFVNLKKSIIIIQRATRPWLSQRRCQGSTLHGQIYTPDLINASVVLQSFIRGWIHRLVFNEMVTQREKTSVMYEEARRCDLQRAAAVTIQSHYHCWSMRKDYMLKKQAVRTIQRAFHSLKNMRDFQLFRKSAIIIQSFARGWMARKRANREKHLLILMQSCCRGWLKRKELSFQKDAAKKIQNAFCCMKNRKAFLYQRHAAVEIQRFVRGVSTRKRLLGSRISNHRFQGLEFKVFVQSVVKLQRWWRDVLQTKKERNAALVIQSHFRGWEGRQRAKRQRHHVVVIQSYWKGYLARKDARGQLVDLRMRMQKSAANVDDSMRLINRLIAALSELLSMRSVSGILHTCATLDVATELSQRCCEKLVAAKAVDILLKLIRSVSRSIPDQQVLKHALSTLRNLARFPHLVETLVETTGCVEIVFQEFLKNKEEGYFIASELLKKICQHEKGVNAVRKSPALLKRLNIIVEELTRKAGNDKRIARNLVAKEHPEKRLKEAVELLRLVTNA